MKWKFAWLSILLTACGMQVTQGRFAVVPPTDPTYLTPVFLECDNGVRQYKLEWTPTALAPEAKTYVAWDTLVDGSFAHTGNGANGNLGHSAQIGASCCRPPADPLIIAGIPDEAAHVLTIMAIDSAGHYLSADPVAIYSVPARTCN